MKFAALMILWNKIHFVILFGKNNFIFILLDVFRGHFNAENCLHKYIHINSPNCLGGAFYGDINHKDGYLFIALDYLSTPDFHHLK